MSGDRIPRGQPQDLIGWAWDGGSGIAGVEVSRDSGRTWRQAVLEKDLGRFAWRGFRVPLDTSRVGKIELQVRAVTRAGAPQPPRLTVNPAGYHHNAIQTLTVEIV